ncbi:hypothetical protein DY000_02040886 [Brassica cretica]|uniref:Uncharacterized protein n=1 Tax=Brassica cretica TaxID=69181 RepID=A0ABQ7B6V5_BRACR|nr:hypothetical protein DY000_02040886 [Brassica cretica]
MGSRLAVDDLPGNRLVNAEMMRQLHAMYGEWLLKDGCWNFVVDHFKGARMFLSEGSTHADLVAMTQEDYNLDTNTKSVELTIPDRITQRKRCTPKYIGRLFIDRVGIIDGLNPQHIKDAMKNMFGMTLDYTTSYRALLYAQEMMMRQLHAVYGEWLMKDGCWNFVVDHFKGARMLFLSEGSTHADLVAMAQEDYNMDMNRESVELTYSLQQMAPNLPHIHVTSDRQVRNLLEITKTHEVRLCA